MLGAAGGPSGWNHHAGPQEVIRRSRGRAAPWGARTADPRTEASGQDEGYAGRHAPEMPVLHRGEWRRLSLTLVRYGGPYRKVLLLRRP